MEEAAPTTPSRLIVKLPLQRENPAPRISQTSSNRAVEPAEIQIIDDEGDLILTVLKAHSQQQTPLRAFKVSSKALSLASPLLKYYIANPAILLNRHSGQAESNEGSGPDGGVIPRKHLKISAKSGSVVELVLNIIHHRHDKIPMAMSIGKLHSIATFCRTYQLQDAVYTAAMHSITIMWPFDPTSAIVPIEKTAIISGCSTDKHPHANEDCPKWLSVAEVFQIDKIIWECMQNLVFHGLADLGDNFVPDGRQARQIPVYSHKHRGYLHHGLPYFTKIWAQRTMLIDGLFNTLAAKDSAFTQAANKCEFLCQGSKDRAAQSACDSFQVREIIKLKAALGIPDGLFTRPYLDNHTLDEIFEVFRRLEPCEPSFIGSVYGKQGEHAECEMSLYFSRVIKRLEEGWYKEAWRQSPVHRIY
ncbi:hypothetical protein TWF751_004968 [Orbilia oligospora]|nr:hypothetical protein TWF751_004968 [Orbilia oligospora]